jgi:hypothetical protein
LTILASTALLAADTFPRTTELWEELDPANKTWAAWKTAYLAANKKRANRLHATGGADYLGRANSAHTTTLNPGLVDSIENAQVCPTLLWFFLLTIPTMGLDTAK